MTEKPIASLSLDLDNQWSYMKTGGHDGWQSYPSYLDLVVPRILDVLDELGLRITFFVVGQDAALDKNGAALARIAAAGHEIANHSFGHEPWLHLYSTKEVETEIVRAEAAIEAATGQCVRGFRGPGFSLSRDVLETLKRRGYDYDASTFPTFLGPLARSYYFWQARLSRVQRDERRQLFGSFADGLRPLGAYYWDLKAGPLLEIPVTTMPLVRAPFHMSYVSFVAQKSPRLAQMYFATALRVCRVAGVAPSVLLHPLDFLGGDDCAPLKYFPGMGLTAKEKLAVTRAVLTKFKSQFEIVPMSGHAAAFADSAKQKKLRAPDFDAPAAGPVAAVGT